MSQTIQQAYTEPRTTPLTLLGGDFVIGFTINPVAGTCSFTGGRSFRGSASTPITIPQGGVYTELAPPGYILDGYTITPAGTTNLVLKF